MTESQSLQYVNSMNCAINRGDGEQGGLSIGHLPLTQSILG